MDQDLVSTSSPRKRLLSTKRFKEEEFDQKNSDMLHTLRSRKKKIVLKEQNFNFKSRDDIYELREAGVDIDEHIRIDLQDKILQVKTPDEIKKEQEQREEEERKMKPSMIMGYQKKIWYEQKKFHDDLVMEEMRDSDDNQDIVLSRLENQYNFGHRSNIYVTGTLSVVLYDNNIPRKVMGTNLVFKADEKSV